MRLNKELTHQSELFETLYYILLKIILLTLINCEDKLNPENYHLQVALMEKLE